MSEQSPEFLTKKFKKLSSFTFVIHCPNLFFYLTNDRVSYTCAEHAKDHTFKYMIEFNTSCSFLYQNFIEIETLSTEKGESLTLLLFSVPCLFTYFKELNSNLKDYDDVGPIMEKLTHAVFYKRYHNLDTTGRSSGKRKQQVSA